jgi:hypothetical protein
MAKIIDFFYQLYQFVKSFGFLTLRNFEGDIPNQRLKALEKVLKSA